MKSENVKLSEKARFSMCDDLVLCTDTLWDPRVPEEIHKFDRFTNYGNGFFSGYLITLCLSLQAILLPLVWKSL